MHSARAGGIVYTHALRTEIHSNVSVLEERGREGESGEEIQERKRRWCRRCREAVTADVVNEGRRCRRG